MLADVYDMHMHSYYEYKSAETNSLGKNLS
jgi:hypothetical protein